MADETDALADVVRGLEAERYRTIRLPKVEVDGPTHQMMIAAAVEEAEREAADRWAYAEIQKACASRRRAARKRLEERKLKVVNE